MRFKTGSDLLLLLHKLTYLLLPRRLRGDDDNLPRAMRLLPLLGLFTGLILYGGMRLFIVMPFTGTAAVLVGVNLLAGGAFLLRDLMRVADGISPDPGTPPPLLHVHDERLPDNSTEIAVKQRRFNVGRAGMLWGLVWLGALYFSYLGMLYYPVRAQAAVVASTVLSRLLMCWIIYYYAALPPATLHNAMSGRQFILAACLAFIVILPISQIPVYLAFLIAFLGLYLFASMRVRSLGGLDEPCYGACCAWGEILFLLSWLMFTRYF